MRFLTPQDRSLYQALLLFGSPLSDDDLEGFARLCFINRVSFSEAWYAYCDSLLLD